MSVLAELHCLRTDQRVTHSTQHGIASCLLFVIFKQCSFVIVNQLAWHSFSRVLVHTEAVITLAKYACTMVLHILGISGWRTTVAHQCSASASWLACMQLGLGSGVTLSTWRCSDDGSSKLWFAVAWMLLRLFSAFMLAFWPDLIPMGARLCACSLEWFTYGFAPMLRNILCRAWAEHEDIWARCLADPLAPI